MAGDQTTGTPVSCHLIVQAGAKPDLRDDLGATPLDVAAAEGDEAMVKLLMPADSPSLAGDLIAKAAKAPRSAGTAAEAPSEAEKVGLCLVALPQPRVRAPDPDSCLHFDTSPDTPRQPGLPAFYSGQGQEPQQ